MTTSVEFTLGAESVTVPLDIQTGDEAILTGDIGGLVAAGTTARLRGNCRLIADLHVRGTLVCDPTGVNLDGQNLFDIHTHDGTLNLVGVEKTAWCRWGDVVVGWEIGDRLAVAPTKVGVYVPTEINWQGSWAATARPPNSPDVALADSTIARPEVTNLSQTVTLRNLKRIMIHEATGPNPQTLKWIKVLNSGKSFAEAGELGHYPIHFHLLGDTCRGSLVEGVVVEGGKNHAFVPHGSHGITFRDCVAYNGVDDQFWWDFSEGDPLNRSNDTVWDRCLVMLVTATEAEQFTITGFMLGAGFGNQCTNSVATCVLGSKNTAGYHWPSRANQEPNVWLFEDCVAHNNKAHGAFVWQNDNDLHVILRFKSYRNGTSGINHGAYRNRYSYHQLTLSENGTFALVSHSLPKVEAGNFILFEDVATDGNLKVEGHNQPSPNPVIYRRATFSQVVYQEGNGDPSYSRFEDCGLTPPDFLFTSIRPTSVIEIYEANMLQHRWAGGWV